MRAPIRRPYRCCIIRNHMEETGFTGNSKRLESLRAPSPGEEARLQREIDAARRKTDGRRAEVGASALALAEKRLRLQESEMELLGLELEKESWRLRSIEQRLKESISWYMPVEDILEMPAIGMDVDEFAAGMAGRAGVIVLADAVDSGNRLGLSITPEHVRRCRGRHEGAHISFGVMPDRTLRPQGVYGYNKLFSYDPESDRGRDVDISLIGSYPRKPCGGFDLNKSAAAVMRVTEWQIRHYKREKAVVHIFDAAGELVDAREHVYIGDDHP